MKPDVLRVRALSVRYHTSGGAVRAADGLTFSLRADERLGIAGESGSGKSTMALSLLRLIKPPGRIESGEIWLDDRDLLTLPEDEMRRLRLARIALVPQGSMNSLNPVLRIEDQVADALRDHGAPATKPQVDARLRDLLPRVGLAPEVARMFPHQLSGGMKQRACIAIAMSLSPRVIVADEPTSALDVVVQKQVMETLARAQTDLGASVILVGHDMGLMAQFVDRLGVMYAGRLVEISPVRDVFTAPLHPYTRMLIASLPSLERKGVFQGIPGLPPPLRALPPGCAFHPRCPLAVERCRSESPGLREVRPDGWAACHLA
ncbi:MAG: ABC transporter ATP-binding protein [Candidatus Rokuibacteriota bacterium]